MITNLKKWWQTLFCAEKIANIWKTVHSTKQMNTEEMIEHKIC
jgi:hypothetical protein